MGTSTLLWILGATGLVSLISFIGIITLAIKRDFLLKILLILVAFAAGSLIGVAFFDLIPEALELSPQSASLYIVAGILAFFAVEKFFGWHHHHHKEDVDPTRFKDHHHDHKKPFVYLSLIGDFVHNFVDGALIATSFLVNPQLGITTTIAVALHEIPQEIGDFAILLHGGLKIKKALFYNFVAALSAVLGGIIAFYLASMIESLAVFLVGIAGGGFLYLAMTDLLPEINKENSWKKSMAQFISMILGLLIIYFMGIFLPGA